MSEADIARDTFAAVLTRFMTERLGYGDALPAEAEALAPACDRVLAWAGESVMQIACIVDRDARPDAVFGLSPEDVLAVVRRWKEGAGRWPRRRPPMSVTIYEVGAGVATPEAERRLRDARRPRSFGRVPAVQAVFVDPQGRVVLENARRFFGRDVVFRWLRVLVKRPGLADAGPAPALVAKDVNGFPVLTAAILAALVAIFLAEVLLPVEPWSGTLKADIRTLLAFGGVDRTLVLGKGEWWRMATAPLLHGDALHILFNGLALWLIGRLSERLMGPAWFAATFAVAALSGSALSIAINPENMLSVGASGAIVGLFVASFTLSFHLPAGSVRTRLQSRTIQTLIPALVPIFSGGHGDKIDYGAHFGGAGGGLVMGLVMLALWPKSLHRPRLAWAAGTMAVGGLLLAAAAAVPGLANYRAVSLYGALYTPWPPTDAEAKRLAYDIVTAKPRDPRGHFVQGLALIGARDLPGAEAELRQALSDPPMLGLLGVPFADRIRVTLGAVLLDEKRPEEARAVLAPACATEKPGSPLRPAIDRLHLCP